jgi:putative transposase
MRYIELNPVRAGMVTHPSEYPWSSYRYNALGQHDERVIPYLEYRRLGKTDKEREAAYRQLFKQRIPNDSLTEIREATNKAWVLGNDRFKQRIQKKLDRRVEPKAKGGDRKSEKFKINRV